MLAERIIRITESTRAMFGRGVRRVEVPQPSEPFLSEIDAAVMREKLHNPPPLNRNMLRAVARYKKVIDDNR